MIIREKNKLHVKRSFDGWGIYRNFRSIAHFKTRDEAIESAMIRAKRIKDAVICIYGKDHRLRSISDKNLDPIKSTLEESQQADRERHGHKDKPLNKEKKMAKLKKYHKQEDLIKDFYKARWSGRVFRGSYFFYKVLKNKKSKVTDKCIELAFMYNPYMNNIEFCKCVQSFSSHKKNGKKVLKFMSHTPVKKRIIKLPKNLHKTTSLLRGVFWKKDMRKLMSDERKKFIKGCKS